MPRPRPRHGRAESRISGRLELGVWSDADLARIEPFDAIELSLADFWGEPPAPR